MTVRGGVVEAEGDSAQVRSRKTASDQGPAKWTKGEVNAFATFPLAIANIALDSSSPLPIHEQICQAVRTAISSQELPPGTLLPPSRELALHLGVARNTVVFAYARLVAEGLCVSNTRRGTRVAADFPARGSFARTPESERTVVTLRPAFHARNALETNIDRMAGGAPFALNASDPVLYPRTKLGRRVAGKFLGAPTSAQAAGAGEADGGRFQASIAAYLRSARGVICAPSQIVSVAGLESALDLTARVLLDPGDSVHVQDPAMDVVRSALQTARASVVAMPCDARGADPKRVSGPPARLMFVSPSVSFPYGVQMPEERRIEILAAAQAQNAIVFEDDTYCELRYSGARTASIQGLDKEGRVIYYSGFLETLGNSVNVGYLVVPPSLVDAFAEVARRMAIAPPVQMREALAEFVEEHEYAVHARTVRSVTAKRLELVKQAFKAHLPGLAMSEPRGGLFLVLHTGAAIDDVAVCNEAAAEGVPVRPLSRYFLGAAPRSGIVFGIGALPERSVKPAVQQLAAVIERHAPTGVERASA